MSVRLNKDIAKTLIDRIFPGLKIVKDSTPSDVAIFRARTGPDGLEIRCENDWFDLNGRIGVTIHDGIGSNSIKMFFFSKTLERDFETEDAYKKRTRMEQIEKWAGDVGAEKARKMIDEFEGI